MAPVLRDKSVKQLGILNIVLGMLCGGINAIGLVTLIHLVDKSIMVVQPIGWIILIGVILLNAAAIASGIGLILYRKWGRVLAMIYAGGTILFILGSIALNISNAAASNDPTAARRALLVHQRLAVGAPGLDPLADILLAHRAVLLVVAAE